MSCFHFVPDILNCATFNILCPSFKQGDDPFWKKKPQEKTAKAPRPKTKVVKRPAKRMVAEPIGLDLDDDLDDPDVEVELDSLGSFFLGPRVELA